jgi:ketosteroid isomerase-like protein
MFDLIAPSAGRDPADVVDLVCVALSDGDLGAAIAQYERGAALRPWAKAVSSPDGSVQHWLGHMMALRLPIAGRVCAVVPAGGVALVIAERHITGADADCLPVDLHGVGATVVRRQPGGAWRIAADAWALAGSGGGIPA